MMVMIKRGKLLGAILDNAPSLNQFEKRHGLPENSLRKVLKNRRCKLTTLERICAGCDWKADDFIDWDAMLKESWI